MLYTDDLAQLRERWIADLRVGAKRYSERTIDGYERQFRKYLILLARVASKKTLDFLDVINHNNAQDVIAQIPADQYSTRYQVYCAVVAFCNFLLKRDMVDEKVRLKLKRARPQRNCDPKRTFFRDEEEIMRFFAAIWAAPGNTHYQKLLIETTAKTLLNTGLRREELCNLAFDDVDLENKQILVRKGKGGKSRRVGINRSLMAALRNYLNDRPASDHPNFFLTECGKPLRPNYLSQRMRRLARRSGIEVSCHSFRRTYATRQSLHGTPTALIQGAFGHTSPLMTLQYVQLQPYNVLEAMQECNFLDPTPTTTERSRQAGVRQGTHREPTDEAWVEAEVLPG